MSSPREPEETAKRAVELGFLPEGKAEDALDTFRRQPDRDLHFGSFLLEQGLIGLEQFAAVQGDAVGESTVAHAALTKVGGVYGGYRVERKLGSGAMGSVYLATQDGESVVIKFLAPLFALKPNSRARFLRTGEVVQRLKHPNVAEVLAVFDDPQAEPYLIMEFVPGEPLGQRLERDWRLEDVDEALALVEQIARALDAAHALGIIHRDVKPDNVLLTPEGVVKVIDFGLAKNTRLDEGLSHPGQVLGTPYYMAPEQWNDTPVDRRADVFSLGSTLYHLLLGRVPFKGTHALDVAHKIVNGECPSPRALREDLSADLELVLLRMLDPQREFRYASMRALLADLDRLARGEPPDVPRLEPIPNGTRFPLLPGKRWTIGRKSSNDLSLRHATVSRHHAEIHRLPSGYVLRDRESSYGTFLGDRRVREALLSDGDSLRIGELPFVFRAGTHHTTLRRDAADQATPRVPRAFLETLAEAGDRRTVLTLIERLDPATREIRVAHARAQLRAHLDPQVAAATAEAFDVALRTDAAVAAERLEALPSRSARPDAASWLNWWGQNWSALPPQLGPVLPELGGLELQLSGAGPEARYALDPAVTTTLGRDEGSTIPLGHRSASRLHATIQRLDQRLAIRDEASRSGTRLNGARVQIALLRAGDTLAFGELTFEVCAASEPEPPASVAWLEPLAFAALLAVAPHATALALARLYSTHQAWITAEAERLAPADPKLRAQLSDGALAAATTWLEAGRAPMGEALGTQDPDAWAQAYEQRRAQLGPQALPVGWGLRDLGPRVRLRRPS